MDNKINIRPTSGVYATYKRLSYQPWTAIAEFVDNSTQSFFNYREELYCLEDFTGLNINITYAYGENGEDTLTINDNAYGMELENFKRAIVLDKPPDDPSGRNEFGMGLKTAACWFGSVWSVTSTQYGSTNLYSAVVDVDKLERDKDEEIDLSISQVPADEHYTIIKIEKLNKKITGARTIGKVRELLGSIYRQDLRTGEIVITYNTNQLSYKEPSVYEETLENGETKKWKQEIDFAVEHEGTKLRVHGFIALRIPASLREAGFTLMRRGRVIVGGPEANYRPNEIFGDTNSFAYQRLFGELHMDDWPVTQAKDEFDWHSSGLEELFINELLPFTKPYRAKAETVRVRQRVETKTVIERTVDELQKSGLIQNASSDPIIDEEDSANVATFDPADVTEEENEIAATTAREADVIIEGPKTYRMPFTYQNTDYVFIVSFDTTNALNPWITVDGEQKPEYTIKINMKHTFFKPFTENREFMVVMTEFAISMVLAEIDAMSISKDGRISASEIRRNMNDILEQIALQGGMRL